MILQKVDLAFGLFLLHGHLVEITVFYVFVDDLGLLKLIWLYLYVILTHAYISEIVVV